MINCHHNNLLAGQFGIDKTKEFVGWKYYWPSLSKDVETYIIGSDVCLTLKAVRHKPYTDLQSLPVLTHQWKNLSMDFVTSLPLSADWKGNSYNSILVIIDRLTKIVYYKPVNVTINAPELAKVIMDVMVQHHGLPKSMMSDRERFLRPSFDPRSVIFSASSNDSPSRSTLRQINR